ncbi:MAG: hypothetical protein PHE02_03585 [Lachnospiraceae bacterium]|nr:hypothetical protein [Lachnospiraceae bacterium]
MKRKVLAVLLSAAMILSVTACGAKKEEAAAPAATTEAVTTAETAAPETAETAGTTEAATEEAASGEEDLQAALDELAAALDGTCWVGMDAEDYTCYALGFGDGQVALYSNVEGDEGVEGYWNIGTDALYIYEDAECTSQIGEIAWSYDEENDVMVLNDTAVMAQVEGDIESAAAAMEQQATAASVGEFLDSTVWAGLDEDSTMAMAFSLKDGQYYMGIMDAEGNTEEHQGTWSIDYDSIYLFDENGEALDTLSWDMAEDGSELYFTVDSTQLTFGLVQTDAASVTDAMVALAEELQ